MGVRFINSFDQGWQSVEFEYLRKSANKIADSWIFLRTLAIILKVFDQQKRASKRKQFNKLIVKGLYLVNKISINILSVKYLVG